MPFGSTKLTPEVRAGATTRTKPEARGGADMIEPALLAFGDCDVAHALLRQIPADVFRRKEFSRVFRLTWSSSAKLNRCTPHQGIPCATVSRGSER